MDKEVILIGGFHEIIELCEDIGLCIVGIIDNHLENEYMGFPVIGADKDAKSLFHNYGDIPLVISPDSPAIRKEIFIQYSDLGYKFKTLISSTARVSKTAIIGNGSIIQHGVNVSSYVQIGNFVKLNTFSNIMHDTIIDDFVTVAPNAVILGRVHVKQGGYIGANSTILPEKMVGISSVIGAGAVVTQDVKDFITVKGIPAK